MPQQPQKVSDVDVITIKEWMAKESHLPQDLSDFMIKKFLHSCYGSLERTKQCIEKFCTNRSLMPEIYTSRDPLSKSLQTAFSITKVTSYKAGENEILIHQYDDPNLDNFVYYDLIKTFAMQADYWLMDNDFFPEGHIIMMDLKDYSLRMIPKSNIMFFRDFLVFLLESMPVRVKQVHIVNYPSYYEKLFALVKPVLPAYICEVLKFHPDYESLHKCVDKKYLPVEYEGEAQSMAEQQLHWVKKIEDTREMFLNENLWKADLKKKPKNKTIENSMTGSFKTLSID